MAYDAKVISVMIASPGDVSLERGFIREAIHGWNDLNANNRKCVLLPVGWETHSAPALSGRPQQIINERVLDSCDLLVGVFWTRLGTPTGVAASGTVEEIQRHLDAGKPAMIYFSNQPVAPGSYDQEQFAALMEFKEWCRGKGLIAEFDDAVSFREMFAHHLQLNVRDDPYLQTLQRASPTPLTSSKQDEDLHEGLTEQARTLLKAAVQGAQGTIMVLSTMGGDIVQANGINFAEGTDARGRAAWRGAVGQLEFHMLIEDRGGKGEVFFVTDEGYRYAERLP